MDLADGGAYSVLPGTLAGGEGDRCPSPRPPFASALALQAAALRALLTPPELSSQRTPTLRRHSF